MSLTVKPTHIFEPTPLQCGQAVIAMLADVSVKEVIDIVGTDRETNLKDMKNALNAFKIGYNPERKEISDKNKLPEIAILSLQTPHCWHWSLYFKGTFYDPEYGILDDFPPSNRRYYWEIENK